MLNNKTDPRSLKDPVYSAFAEVTKALGSPRRLELLDLLDQGPRSVEALAQGTSTPMASTSQHLQVLKRARLVLTRREGTTVEYRLAPEVAPVLVALRRLAEARSPDLVPARERWFAEAGAPEVISSEDLAAALTEERALLLDVRPSAEYRHAHVAGALSVPLAELSEHLGALPRDRLFVATCRGPSCTFAAEAVRLLRASGRQAVRYEGGVSDWAMDGGLVEHGVHA